MADRFSKHKESFFTEHEIASIKGLKFEENLFLKEPDPEHEEGIIAKLCRILLKINPDSNFSYWIVNILSSLSRGFDARFIYWILEGGVLNVKKRISSLFFRGLIFHYFTAHTCITDDQSIFFDITNPFRLLGRCIFLKTLCKTHYLF